MPKLICQQSEHRFTLCITELFVPLQINILKVSEDHADVQNTASHPKGCLQ